MSVALSSCVPISVCTAERLQVSGEMTGSSVFERHHEAKSNGTIIFYRKKWTPTQPAGGARGAAQADG